MNAIRHLATIAIGLWFTQAASAEITIVKSERGFLGSNKAQITTTHNGSTEVELDATGASKLVVAIGTESGFNSQAVTNMTLSFNGVAMTRAVFGNDRLVSTNDAGGVAIFYLDEPFQGAATFTFGWTTTSGTPNGGIASIFALSGTAPGVGNTAQSSASLASSGTVSTNITTSADNAWVLAAVQNSGNNNAAGTPTVAETTPAFTLGHNGFWGSQWGSLASSYADVPTSGTSLTPTFNTATANNIQIIAAEFLPAPPPPSFQLVITPNGDDFDFTWDSLPGKVYDLVTSTDLATPIPDWPVYDPDGLGEDSPYANIPATGTTTTLTEVPGDGPKRFFAMVEKDGPPLFSWDFEDDNGGFEATGTPNDWAWGTPDSDNNAGLIVNGGNGGPGTKCWGTNLGDGDENFGGITSGANSILRSPEIDLTGITGAKLSFAAAYDARAGDEIRIVIKDADTDTPIGTAITPIDTTADTSSDWTTLGPFDLSEANDTKIHLEFHYEGSSNLYIGLYIDDVTVTP